MKQATALAYNGTDTPRVVATGSGDIATVIERLAAEHNIPIIQDPSLSALLALVPRGEDIPPQLYTAVATVLAYVFNISGRDPLSQLKSANERQDSTVGVNDPG